MASQNLKYKGYVITADPYQAEESGKWTFHVRIARFSRGIKSKDFFSEETYETEEEALNGCLDFGKKVIDGDVLGCSVKDL